MTRLLILMDIEGYFEKRKKKISDIRIVEIEARIYGMIKGTPPGEKYWQ